MSVASYYYSKGSRLRSSHCLLRDGTHKNTNKSHSNKKLSLATCNCTAMTTGSLELRKRVVTAKIIINEIASKKLDEKSEILNAQNYMGH